MEAGPNGLAPGPDCQAEAERYAQLTRMPGEPRRARQALQGFLAMGPGRSLEGMYLRGEQPPCRLRTLQGWYDRFNWQERAGQFDELRQEAAEQSRRRALQERLADTAKRVEHLNELFIDLQRYFHKALAVWEADLDAPDESRKVNSRAPRFSPGIVNCLRGVLEDIAHETGGRALRVAPVLPEIDPQSPPPFDISLLDDEQQESLRRLVDLGTPEKPPSRPWQPGLPGIPQGR